VIPMADENPLRRMPWVTIVLIFTCCAVYFAVQPTKHAFDQLLDPTVQQTTSSELRFIVDNAAIPCEITQGRPLSNREFRDTYVFGQTSSCDHGDDGSGSHEPGKSVYLALVLSLFLHGSPQHLFGNMLFLWVFGNNIEDRKGGFRFLVLYLLAGVAATLAHVLSDPNSTVPIIGASGAIAGVMGAYLVLYPTASVTTLVPFLFIFFIRLPAWLVLGYWFIGQFLSGAATSIAYSRETSGGGVAFWAHVGGFVAGVILIKVFPARVRRAVPYRGW
jgi:membrane associated rhomboid family serine protease